MAYGTSALAMLDAMTAHHLDGDRRLVSIDPNQATDWDDIGVRNVQRAGYADSFTLDRRPNYLALPALVAEGFEADVVFVDGWHTFDHTFLDVWYADKLLRIGGVLILHDFTMPGVYRAARALMAHRDYGHHREYEVVRPRVNRAVSPARRWLHRRRHGFTHVVDASAWARTGMAVLCKQSVQVSDDWAHYRRF